MVVKVLQVKVDGLADQVGLLAAEQAVDHFAQGPDRSAQQDHFPLQDMDPMQGLGGRIVDQFLLHELDFLPHLFEYRKVVVNYRVEQGVGQIIGLHLADAPLAVANPVAHPVKGVPRLFLKREQVVLAQDEADLFHVDLPGVGVIGLHLDDQKNIVIENIQLGALGGVEDILDGQGVDAEAGTEVLDDLDPMQPVDVDPGDRGFLPVDRALLRIFRVDDFVAGLVIIYDRYFDFLGDLGAHMHRCPRREAGLE